MILRTFEELVNTQMVSNHETMLNVDHNVQSVK